MQQPSNWIFLELTSMVKNEVGETNDLSFTTCFLTSEKHSFGVRTDKSPKICTHVEQIYLYKAGLLLNIDVAVPFFKEKILPKTVFPFSAYLIARVGRYRRPIRGLHLFWLTGHFIPLEPLGASGLANVLHKCTLIMFFCKVNNILNQWTIFRTVALAVI